MEKLTTLNRIHKEKIMAVVRVETVERGAEIVEGCLAGGVSILEISYTNANAGEIIQQLTQAYGDKVLLGQGPSWMHPLHAMLFYEEQNL